MSHPYKKLPAYTRWSKAVVEPPCAQVDPVTPLPFKISPTDRIVTAGSCFAQHIARYLKNEKFNHYVAEAGHRAIHPEIRAQHNYGIFSARYGNVYTSRQLLQLFRRATGRFEPEENVWEAEGGRFVDPFRPTIQPGNFFTIAELQADRRAHLRAVKRAMRNLDIFIFTLGLTETWVSKIDGAAFPLCPGVEGGKFDPDKHALLNLSVQDVVSDMRSAIWLLRKFNPRAKIILTVSPVPLAATAVDRHVLVSTTLSKSVLRVSADILSNSVPNVVYFPSYEIITGAYSRGAYFAKDLRSVTDSGVDHVMRLFFKHATAIDPVAATAAPAPSNESEDNFGEIMESVTEAICEEALLDR